MSVTLVQGDITTARTDAIVNAANPAMLGGGGVDGAIHRAAGKELLAYCRQQPDFGGVRCPVGEARITPAGNLYARFVIHTVGPRYAIDPSPEQLLASAYRSALQLALDNQCRSVAMPALSCGVYGYPPEEAAPIALGVCAESSWQSLEISFYLFGARMMQTWQQAQVEQDKSAEVTG